jgi:hypothetical protein
MLMGAIGLAPMVAGLLVMLPPSAEAGGPTPRMATSGSMARQNAVARAEGYTFLRTPAEVWAEVAAGRLVRVESNGDVELAGASFPVTRPEVALFLAHLGAAHRTACGTPLVVTSLTRPIVRQPSNASHHSVHPAGMAVDLRIPRDVQCRRWLESRLLAMQAADLLEVLREQRPPHYHVGIFPSAFRGYVEQELMREAFSMAEGDARERLRQVREVVDRIALEPPAPPARGRVRWGMLLVAAPLGMLFWVPAGVRTLMAERRPLEWWLALGSAVLVRPDRPPRGG